ncbi:leucyl aminopeptidase family protein [Bermanella marisrubri]|nr:leucyl aminopeptidase family protein [Bermanella marisrubri]
MTCTSRHCDSIVHSQDGIPLKLFSVTEYESWLQLQDSFTQNILQPLHLHKSGAATIPNIKGETALAIAVSADPSDLWAFANLPKQLPAQQYKLEDSPYGDNLAMTWGLATYQFSRYLKQQEDQTHITLAIPDKNLYEEAQRQIQAVTLVRDLVNTPAGDMMPQDLAATTKYLAEEFNGSFNEIVDASLIEQNYPMIHAVGRASENRPRLLELKWGKESDPKVTLVGKGVCFDSGGLDLKPANAMRLMKKDMGGAAHVLGVAHLVMSHALPVQLRVLIPAVENAVSANAFRPGDVLNTRKGLKVEIDNTDAEGRLVLCDALTDACEQNPDLIIDFATLTGACRIALGTELPGYFSNSNEIAHALFQAGSQTQDPVWQLPLHTPYKDMIKSDVADMVNSAASPFGGAITAALYLQAFIENDTPWIHFDVMAWNNRTLPGRPSGGEAMGVRAVFEMLQGRYGQ